MKNRRAKQETEVYRAFRLTRAGFEQMTDGEIQGAFQRLIVELVARDKSAVIVEHLRRQADLLATSKERMAAPRKKKHPWRIYECGKPRDNTWDQPEPKPNGRAKVTAADRSVQRAFAVEDAPFGGENDTTPGTSRDRKFEDAQIADAIEDATDWQAEKVAERTKEAEHIEMGLWRLVADNQAKADGHADKGE